MEQILQPSSRRLSSFLSSKNHILKSTRQLHVRTGANVFIFLKYEGRNYSYGNDFSETEIVQEWRDMVARDRDRGLFEKRDLKLKKTDDDGDIPLGWLSVGSHNPTDKLLIPPQSATVGMLKDGDRRCPIQVISLSSEEGVITLENHPFFS